MCVSSYLWPADQQAIWVSSLSLQNRLVVSEELAGASLYLWRELTARPSELWALVPPSFILYKTNHLIYHPADPSGSIWLTAIIPNLTMGEEMTIRESFTNHKMAVATKTGEDGIGSNRFNSVKCQGLLTSLQILSWCRFLLNQGLRSNQIR